MIYLFCGHILSLKLTQNFLLRGLFMFYHSISEREKTGNAMEHGKGVQPLFEARIESDVSASPLRGCLAPEKVP